jgi:hypothetical protein
MPVDVNAHSGILIASQFGWASGQQSYLQTLAREAGREVELDGMSKADASKLIDELQITFGRGTPHSPS